MSALATLLIDAFIAIVIAVASIIVQASLGLGNWAIPLTFLPCAVWCWWRGAMPHVSLPQILLVLGTISVYLAIKQALWPNPPGWSRMVDAVLLGAILQLANLLSRRRGSVEIES